MIFVIIHTPWPTSKSLDHPYLHVYTCLLQCFMLMLAYLVLGFVTLDALSECVVMWLHSTPIRPCLDVIAWNASPWCCLLRAYISHFPLHVMMCLPCLFVPPVGFICIFTHLLTCPCISLACWCVVHTSTQWSYAHSIQTYICPSRTLPFVRFLACLLAFLLCFPCLSCSSVLCIFIYSLHLSFHCLSVGFLSLPLHVHT